MSDSSSIREKILHLRQINPELRGSEIAAQLGVSRERIRQLLVELNLPTRIRSIEACQYCGKLFNTRRGKRKEYCSRTCRKAAIFTTITCSACGLEFKISSKLLQRRLRLKYKHFFCSRSCSRKYVGKYVGSTYGWKALAKKYGAHYKTYNYSLVAYLYELSPINGNKASFARSLGILRGSIYHVLRRGQKLLGSNASQPSGST